MARRRRHALAVVLATGLLSTAACAAETTAASADEVAIGVSIELSGPAQVQGEAYQKALQLEAERINAAGIKVGDKTYKLNLIIRDNKSDPTESLQVVKSMIDNDKVVGIVGGGSSPTTMSIVDTVESRGVPTVSMGSSGAIVAPLDKRKFVFKTPANTNLIVDKMIDEFGQHDIKKIALLSVDNAYGQAGVGAFDAAVKAGKIDVVAQEKFTDRDKDFTVQVTKLLAAKPDAIVVWSIPPGSTVAAKNIKASGFEGKVFFDAGAGAELFIKGAGAESEGMYMVHPAVLAGAQITGDSPAEKVQRDFFEQYSIKYGNFSGFASYGADALRLLVAAIEKAGSLDRQKIRDALEQLNYDGVTGRYEFSAEDHGGVTRDSLALLVVRDGVWVPAR
ncbi:MAG TPA: ABC transporter substrate-binding protein [Micromonosporaceae bacterium]|nr:ABC transporter substrate-binding protein [Micromonosporaceae bacterium]